ncbi:hypothetical protein BC826DRAFT_411492 [Russula brevipes]|nr:hypothetical protein BC826DRAFT_411492 [Russula brevipes]
MKANARCGRAILRGASWNGYKLYYRCTAYLRGTPPRKPLHPCACKFTNPRSKRPWSSSKFPLPRMTNFSGHRRSPPQSRAVPTRRVNVTACSQLLQRTSDVLPAEGGPEDCFGHKITTTPELNSAGARPMIDGKVLPRADKGHFTLQPPYLTNVSETKMIIREIVLYGLKEISWGTEGPSVLT